MTRLLLFTLILCASCGAYAQALQPKADIESWLNKDLFLASGYQQQSYSLKDIQGDIALLGFARTNMLRIKLMVKQDETGLRELLGKQQDGFDRYKAEYPQWDFNQLDATPMDTTLTHERIESFAISDESKKLLKGKVLGQDVAFMFTQGDWEREDGRSRPPFPR